MDDKRPDLNLLLALDALLTEQNVTRAARRLNLSQPALSAQLAQLEDALGVRLFERDRRRVLLTSAGRDLVERARRVLSEAEDLVDAAARAGDPLSGRLSVGVIPTISPYLLPAAAPALRKAYPRLSVMWREDKTADLVRVDACRGGDMPSPMLQLSR